MPHSIVSEKVLWKLLLCSSCPPAGTLCFHGFSKGHISITLMGINSCSTNLQQIGGYRHREQRERQESNDWLTWCCLGQGWHLVPQFSWMWIPRQQPKAFLISISISRKNYNENKSYWGREQILNIKVHSRQELVKGKITEVYLLDLTKYKVKLPYNFWTIQYLQEKFPNLVNYYSFLPISMHLLGIIEL